MEPRKRNRQNKKGFGEASGTLIVTARLLGYIQYTG